ncbi:hypothetical protein GLAREA_01015 [Glarea lozoyensis ATCC 20868]|uniref:Uncharacterized protein n=1 Tax=Glarea lozoyensis (strain ATCC 20868 / MF5171) TaxID=1116229 RepID=S3CW61_GLAL2|nr:uncharacterized protein GLAREA_01015 [Glarea lozoyensis ATCC 20868]EPE29855.1 hypothetical protein GLAREA_01015 [Glarea lozoyensis ATCC 20868]
MQPNFDPMDWTNEMEENPHLSLVPLPNEGFGGAEGEAALLSGNQQPSEETPQAPNLHHDFYPAHYMHDGTGLHRTHNNLGSIDASTAPSEQDNFGVHFSGSQPFRIATNHISDAFSDDVASLRLADTGLLDNGFFSLRSIQRPPMDHFERNLVYSNAIGVMNMDNENSGPMSIHAGMNAFEDILPRDSSFVADLESADGGFFFNERFR